jgi:hypothetical protein
LCGSRHDVDNRASAIAELRISVGLLNFELLNGFHRDKEGLLQVGIVVAIHHANAVEQHVDLRIPASVCDKIRDEPGRAHGDPYVAPGACETPEAKKARSNGFRFTSGRSFTSSRLSFIPALAPSTLTTGGGFWNQNAFPACRKLKPRIGG